MMSKQEKLMWIPKGLILFFAIAFTILIAYSYIFEKRIFEIEFLDFEIYTVFAWISFLVSILVKKYVSLFYLLINIVGMSSLLFYIGNYSYYCGSSKIFELFFLGVFYLPSVVIISVLLFIFSRKRKINTN